MSGEMWGTSFTRPEPWKYTICLKQHLVDDHDPEGEELKEIARKMASEIRQARDYRTPEQMQRIRDGELYTKYDTLGSVVEELENASDLADLNSALNLLYDWADEHRVWIGGDRKADFRER
jgi:hypothetical protein